MPIYVYSCEECGKEFKARHSIKEKYTSCQEIEDCEMSGTLKRLPSNFCTQHKQFEQERKVGSLVKDFIESNKEDLKIEKEILRNQEYKE
jgi:putative FmdB family regulatory protein